MLQLLIVDDEADIRDSLAAYPWHDLDINAAVCNHGMEALKHLEENHIDLIITDIRMPVMDGLELVKRVAAHYPYIQIIILSGYDDFSYAQTCIHYGVSDYLLKPVNTEKLLSAVQRLKKSKLSADELKERARCLERKSLLLLRNLRSAFIERLLSKPLTAGEIEDGLAASEMMLDEARYTVILIRLDRATLHQQDYEDKEWALIVFALGNLLSEIWEDEGLGYFYIDKQTGNCYLISAVHSSLIDQVHHLRKQLYRFIGLIRSKLSIVVSIPVDNVSDLYISKLKAERMLPKLPEGGFEAIVDFDPLAHSPQSAKTPDKSLSDSGLSIVNKAKQYIYANFAKPLTLTEVANAIHVNSSYLSHLFTETTGNTYVHYLSMCRTEKAKTLLQNPHLKVYEVGEMVGYQNPRYFSSIFRKLTGMTPNEYRMQKV